MATNLLHDLIKIKYANEGYLPNTPYHQISDNEMLSAFIRNDNDWEFGQNGEVIISVADLPYLHGYLIDTYPCPSDDLLEEYAALLSSIVTNSYYSYKSMGKGDVNLDGLVNFSDVLLMRRYIAGLTNLTDMQIEMGDMNNDGELNNKDILLLRQLLESGQTGNYILSDVIVSNWVYSYMLGTVVGQNSSIPDKHDLLVMLGTDNTYDEYDEKSAKACLTVSTEYLTRIGDSSRAPTMFGEPHIIKELRLKESSL